MAAQTDKKHFLLVSVPGYGHTIPMIGLARKLSRHHKVSFAICKSAVEHIRKKQEITVEDEKSITVIGLEDGTPPNESEDIVIYTSFMGFKDGGVPAVHRFIKELHVAGQPKPEVTEILYNISVPVNVLIADIFIAAALPVCVERNLPYYFLNCSSIGPFRSMLYVTERTPTEEKNDLETFEVIRPESEGPQPAIGHMMKGLCLSMNQFLSTANGVLINSFREIEQPFIDEIKEDPRMSNLEYYCVGPFMPEVTDTNRSHAELGEKVSRWLDRQADNSVVYVSFGSVVQPNEDRVAEVAKAVLALKKPFIVSLRQHQHASLPEELRTGIESQLDNPDAPGLFLHWAPQKLILGHRSIAVFVSHCGWNSTIESLFNGKPMVGWPIFGDQLENALWIEKSGFGESLIRKEHANDDAAKKITGDKVAAAVKRVGYDNEAARKTAMMWKDKIRAAVTPNGSSTKELQQFINATP